MELARRARLAARRAVAIEAGPADARAHVLAAGLRVCIVSTACPAV